MFRRSLPTCWKIRSTLNCPGSWCAYPRSLWKRPSGASNQVVRGVRGGPDVQVDQVSGVPQLLIRPNREAVARYGLNISDVQETIRAAVGGVETGQIFEGIKRFDIFVRYAKDARETPEAIREILVQAPTATAFRSISSRRSRKSLGLARLLERITNASLRCSVMWSIGISAPLWQKHRIGSMK